MKDDKEFCRIIDELIDGWCERRALTPLRILLPAWPLGMGLTDDWNRIREALRHVRAMAGKALPQSEQDRLNDLIASVDKILCSTEDALMFGSHLSIAGGMHNALLEAEQLGMTCVQVFTKNQQQWNCTPLGADAIETWRTHCSRLKFDRVVSHDSYLINLASPDPALRAKSIALFIEELSRCAVLKIPYLVTHPGAHMGEGEEVGLRRVAEALDEVHATIPADGVITCLEITAGQGSSLGYKLEHLAEIIDLVKEPRRLGVCLDTAHLFAAGYDFRGRKYAGFRKQLEKTVGLSRVKVLHLNDSKKELGSRVDRHEHIGRGTIGVSGFKPFLRDKLFANVPKILETAKGKDEKGRQWDAVNLEVLRSLM